MGWIDRIFWAFLILLSISFISNMIAGNISITNDVKSPNDMPIIFSFCSIALLPGGLFCIFKKHKIVGEVVTYHSNGSKDSYEDARSYLFDFWFTVAMLIGLGYSVIAYSMPYGDGTQRFIETFVLFLVLLVVLMLLSKKRVKISPKLM